MVNGVLFSCGDEHITTHCKHMEEEALHDPVKDSSGECFGSFWNNLLFSQLNCLLSLPTSFAYLSSRKSYCIHNTRLQVSDH